MLIDQDNLYIVHACKKQKGRAEVFELNKARKRISEILESMKSGVNKMAFKKIDVKEIVQQKINTDPESAAAYNEIKKEYSLIDQITKFRKEIGMSQEELAEKIGVSQQVISRFERERHTPNLENLIKILDGLNLEIVLKEKEFIYDSKSR